jgi:small-conductance mechanosensitive channel
VFSGLSLLIESPFRPGDLILFGNDKVGEVERLGLRSTRIYSIADHSTVYLPNKSLSANMLMNISKPTVEQKYSIAVTLPPNQDMARAQEELRLIALAHPNVVTDDLGKKIVLLRERIALNQSRAGALPADDPGRWTLLDEASKYQQAVEKIALEEKLNHSLLTLQEMLFNLVLAIREREGGGFSAKEVQELRAQSVVPVAEAFQRVGDQAEAWSQAADPWIPDREQRQQRKAWSERNQRLRQKWENLQQHLMRPRGKTELRLDDVTIAVLDWLKNDYKILPEDWKNPEVMFKAFTEEGTQLQLWLFVDNVRLEHYSRPQRVITEIARQIREHLAHPVS